jgi:DNA-directed RNA polymerase subunit K/omega
MIRENMNTFEFVVVAALRAAQLARGCTPRLEASEKVTVTARREVLAGTIRSTAPGPKPVDGI